MQWNRSNAIGLSKTSCLQCHGQGVRIVLKTKEVPCNCVYRAVFRACYNRFREYAAQGAGASTVSLEFCRGRDGQRTYSRKWEEYTADFCLVSRRFLDAFEYKVFRFHFLLGADWRLCCRQMKIDRGTFFHAVYRIEQELGRAFAQLQPYALYPVNEYFGGLVHREPRPALEPLRRPPPTRLIPPLQGRLRLVA